MLRPRPAIWFELLVSREHYARAMQTLAASGAAELDARPLEGSAPVLPRLDEFFAVFRVFETEYGPYWPEQRGHAGLVFDDPIAVVGEIQARLADWAQRADPLVAERRACSARRAELDLIARLIDAVPQDTPLPTGTRPEHHLIEHAIFHVPDPKADMPDVDGALFESFAAEDGVFAIVLANEQDMDQVIDGMKAIHAARVPLPDFLSAEPSAHKAEIADRIEAARLRCLANIEQFDALAEDTQLAGLLNRVAVIEWLQANSGDVSASRHMMRITGWTSSADGRDLRALLDAAHLEYALTLVDTAPGDPPMVLENPRWFKPFEFFPRMLGVPADRNVDPSVLVAVIAPVLFGFMFGDVGQGAVLLIAGLVLSRRIPLLALLIPAGAMAMVFGVLFGSVFSVEHVILALWLRPLNEPITILAVALGLGVVLLLLGQAMELVQAVWQGKLRHWLGEAGAVSLAWVGLLGAWFVPPLAWLSLAGLALALVLARDEAGAPGLAASGKAAAEFAEGLMRLLVSTVSFARVGAFALAHAGLSAAIVGVADALGGVGFWIALIVGNLIIIALEGLVTGIQTTRLILFEFFLRFFKAEGREFHPLSVPQIHAKQGTTP